MSRTAVSDATGVRADAGHLSTTRSPMSHRTLNTNSVARPTLSHYGLRPTDLDATRHGRDGTLGLGSTVTIRVLEQQQADV